MNHVLAKNNLESAQPDDSAQAPRFQQIADQIRSSIAVGDLAAHAALPSERSIAKDQGGGRMTARHALEALESAGLVYSEDRRNRFVSPHRLTYDISNMVSFVADSQTRGTDLEIKIIQVRKAAEADASVATHLGEPPGEAVFEYMRLFAPTGTPFCLGRQFWRGELAEFSAHAIITPEDCS